MRLYGVDSGWAFRTYPTFDEAWAAFEHARFCGTLVAAAPNVPVGTSWITLA